MPANAAKLTSIVEKYLSELRRLRDSGGATAELSTYTALANLINAVGATLRPKVFCVVGLADQSARHPDMDLYAASQVQKGKPRPGQVPERGVVEVKAKQGAKPLSVVYTYASVTTSLTKGGPTWAFLRMVRGVEL